MTSLEKQKDKHTEYLQNTQPKDHMKTHIYPQEKREGQKIKPSWRKYKQIFEDTKILDLISRERQIKTFTPIGTPERLSG